MKRSVMFRDPRGHFICREAALWVWLPLLLSWSYRRSLFSSSLRRIAEYCVTQAAEKYRDASRSLLEEWNPDKLADAGAWRPNRLHNEAQQWLRKRDVLLKALADIEAIERES